MFGPMAILFLCNGKLFHVSLISNSPRDRAGIARSQPDRSKSDSERVTAISTRNAPSVSTDRPGTGSDRIWVRSFANTALDLLVGSPSVADDWATKREMLRKDAADAIAFAQQE